MAIGQIIRKGWRRPVELAVDLRVAIGILQHLGRSLQEQRPTKYNRHPIPDRQSKRAGESLTVNLIVR